jgi:hypothetical protein
MAGPSEKEVQNHCNGHSILAAVLFHERKTMQKSRFGTPELPMSVSSTSRYRRSKCILIAIELRIGSRAGCSLVLLPFSRTCLPLSSPVVRNPILTQPMKICINCTAMRKSKHSLWSQNEMEIYASPRWTSILI